MTVDAGIQSWTVPFTGRYRIEAWGAGGGISLTYNSFPGRGAYLRGDFNLTEGQVLKVLVGQKGDDSNRSGGAGGGTFVVDANNDPLIVAGGGGACHDGDNDRPIIDAHLEQNGKRGAGGSPCDGGQNGQGGSACGKPGGGGLLGNGGAGQSEATGGFPS